MLRPGSHRAAILSDCKALNSGAHGAAALQKINIYDLRSTTRMASVLDAPFARLPFWQAMLLWIEIYNLCRIIAVGRTTAADASNHIQKTQEQPS